MFNKRATEREFLKWFALRADDEFIPAEYLTYANRQFLMNSDLFDYEENSQCFVLTKKGAQKLRETFGVPLTPDQVETLFDKVFSQDNVGSVMIAPVEQRAILLSYMKLAVEYNVYRKSPFLEKSNLEKYQKMAGGNGTIEIINPETGMRSWCLVDKVNLAGEVILWEIHESESFTFTGQQFVLHYTAIEPID